MAIVAIVYLSRICHASDALQFEPGFQVISKRALAAGAPTAEPLCRAAAQPHHRFLAPGSWNSREGGEPILRAWGPYEHMALVLALALTAGRAIVFPIMGVKPHGYRTKRMGGCSARRL